MHADSRLRADLAMVLVALFWGVTFPLIRSALVALSPEQFVGWRFLIAALAFLPLVLVDPRARAGLRPAVGAALLLGVLSWASYFAQTIGLQTVSAGRGAFLTGTSVIIVPLLAPLFRSGRPTRLDLIAAIVATLGLYILTVGDESAAGGFGAGDLWILGCAVLYAVYILVLQKILDRGAHPTSLAFLQIAAIAVIADAVLVARGVPRIPMDRDIAIALLVCATLATGGTFWLQARFQGETTPQRVALIFALEPVFATAFAWWLLGERIGLTGLSGAALVLLAVVGVELGASRRVA